MCVCVCVCVCVTKIETEYRNNTFFFLSSHTHTCTNTHPLESRPPLATLTHIKQSVNPNFCLISLDLFITLFKAITST